MKKFAVILAGCGVYDGAEIHEAVLTLLAIRTNGAEYSIFAPDIDQYEVINHLTEKEMSTRRNVLVESARIARGDISPLSKFKAADFDILFFPGGFGVVKNLSTYAIDGINARINSEVRNAVNEMVAMKKPIGAICIAPVLIAGIIGDNVELTIGNDLLTATDINKMGATHKNTTEGEILVDRKYKLVSSPCYMLDSPVEQVWESIDKVVKELLRFS